MITRYLGLYFISYLTGSIPFSYFLAKIFFKKDLTEIGSGNVGALNVRRISNSWFFFFVALLLDGLKGGFAVLLGRLSVKNYQLLPLPAIWGAIFASVLGHNFSLFLFILKGKLSGGKGMATAGGALLFYRWPLLVLAIAIALTLIFSTGYILLGQMGVIFSLPLISYFLYPGDSPFLALLAFLVLLKHLPRIKLFFQGKEPKWYYKIKN